MEIIEAINTISNMGVPVVCMVLMWYFSKSVLDTMNTTLTGLEKTIDENTKVLTQIYENTRK